MSEQQPGEESPYERLLGDAMAGDGTLFTREDAIEAAWAVVDPVLKNHPRVRPYKRRSWGPKRGRCPHRFRWPVAQSQTQRDFAMLSR